MIIMTNGLALYLRRAGRRLSARRGHAGLLAISAQLAERGMRAPSGRPYSASSVKAMLRRPL